MIINDKAIGCAKDQTTTEYCSEAVNAMNEVIRLNKIVLDLNDTVARLRETNKMLQAQLQDLTNHLEKQSRFSWKFW